MRPVQAEKAVFVQAGDDAKAMCDRIKALADAGVHHFILSFRPPFDRALLRRFAGGVSAARRLKAENQIRR